MNYVVEFAVFPGALGLDITGPLEVFNTTSTVMAHMKKFSCGYSARFVALRAGAVRLSSGLEIVAHHDFNITSPVDILLVPGGNDVEAVINDADFMDYVRRRAQQAKRVVSVCKGAFILAAAGLLDGKRATTHWGVVDEFAKCYPNVRVQSDIIFIEDDKVYTSAGVTTGIDLALAIVEEDFGAAVATDVSQLLVLYFRRPGFQAQFSEPLKAQILARQRFATLHDWLIANLRQSISVEQMANYLAMSPRNFARVFKSETGISPKKYLEALRIDRAREIMLVGDESLTQIATICGFGREERLRRAFLRRFGVTPSQYRVYFSQS